MTQNTFKPLTSAATRVFLIEGRARFDHKPSYQSCLKLTAVTKSFGDLTRIEVPNPDEYGKFDEVGEIRGASARATSSLVGYYSLDLKSTLLRLGADGCAVDVQLHIGECKTPSQFTLFDKAMILENVFLSQYATGDLGALASGENATVNETADISAKEIYEVLPVSYGVKAGSIVTNEVVAGALCDSPSCGECSSESNGCKKLFYVTKNAGGSPSTPADLVYSLDGGITWCAYDISGMLAASDPTGVACIGEYLVIISNAENALFYTLLSSLDGIHPSTFTKVTTGFVRGPNAIFSVSNKVFIVADFGYVYSSEDVTAGVTAIETGTATISKLNDIWALSSEFAVAVGNDGAVIYTLDGVSWSLAATSPVGIGTHLKCVYAKSESEWIVGTSGGKLFYTLNSGSTWVEKSFPGSGSGSVLDISGANDSVLWMAHQTSVTKGRILRSYDRGYQWVVTPEGSGSIPVADKYNVLLTCSYDANFISAGGLADDAADGIIIVGGA